MKAARVILILCFLAACVEVAVRYATLPPWMASQFGAGGEPKSSMAKPNFFALFLGMQLFLVVLFVALPRWLGRLPVNLPHRDYWLAPERRAETLARIEREMLWMGVATQIFFLVVQHEVIEANVHRGPLSDRFSTYLVLYLAYTVLWTWLFVVYFWRKPKASASQG